MKNPKFSYTIRALCGLYLLWIVKDFAGALRDGEKLSVAMIAAMVLFAVCGVLFIITGVRGWLRVNKQLQEEGEKPEEEKAETVPQKTSDTSGMSITDRANLVRAMNLEEDLDEDADQEEVEAMDSLTEDGEQPAEEASVSEENSEKE